ncbi:hypothetical protein C0993_003466 [Termitomyces sp. T159_Od127]|nr:hypothetical protein C0993_003466 [Termitomyces sp. T159_Od127]
MLKRVKHGTDSKVILLTGNNIPNYLELKSCQERVDKWHRHNPGNVATGTPSGNTNLDVDQHVQQQFIHKVLHLNSVGDRGGLSKENCIAALKKELIALKNQVFDGVEITKPKQLLKGYKLMVTVANDPMPLASEPSIPPSAMPVDSTPPVAVTTHY